MNKKLIINGEEIKPIKKHKLWEHVDWTPAKIKKMLENKQKELANKK